MSKNVWKGIALALAVMLGVVVGGQSGVHEASADRQPHMQRALDALQSAKSQLQSATHDKGGHRARALELTNEAIEQTRKGIAFDNKR